MRNAKEVREENVAIKQVVTAITYQVGRAVVISVYDSVQTAVTKTAKYVDLTAIGKQEEAERMAHVIAIECVTQFLLGYGAVSPDTDPEIVSLAYTEIT